MLRTQNINCRPTRRRLVLMVTMALLFCSMIDAAAYQASTVVRGNVTDESGASLPGVNVIEKGTTNGTVTDAEGRFQLSVASPESVVIFSFVGTVTQEVRIGAQTELTIRLLSDVQALSEIVVVGYGIQEKRDVTGSVASVKSDEFNRGIINSPEQLVQGKIAGVNVTSVSGEPGARQTITVRGPGGIRTGSTPLFVVDGMALDNSSTGGTGNPLNFLNPEDIESIDVLKDASATAIYGSRGANGVVLITTKKGKAGVSMANYSVNAGFSKMARPIELFSADEYRQQVPSVGGVLDDQGNSTDWQDVISRTAVTQNHNLNFGGGSENLTYYASLGMQDQQGILLNSEMKRYSGRINVTQKLLDNRLKVDLNLNATNTYSEKPPIEGLIGSALAMNPTYAPYDVNGDIIRYQNISNPLVAAEINRDYTRINRVIGNISPSLTIIKGLEYRLNFGIDNASGTRDIEALPSAVPLQEGRLEAQYNSNFNSLIENFVTYSLDKGQHHLSALAGHSYQKFNVQTRTWSINRFPISGVEPINNPGTGQDLTLVNNRPTGSTTRNELQSFFGRVTYDWNNKYLATATIRADGSSKFGANNKYGVFPSFSLGWRLSEENFLKGTTVSNLKLRAGYGMTGNQEIPNKITQALFTSQIAAGASYPLGPGAYPAGTTYARLANPNIQWEVSKQTNVGMDFGILDGAFTGSIDYFRKVSDNILLEVIPSDPVQPAGSFWTNVEDMTITNSGLEIALNYQWVSTGSLRYQVGGNITFINNEVENSPYSVIPSGSATGSGLTSSTINGYVNGQPIGTFFLKQFTGFDATGLSTYQDTDGDGIVTDKDRVAAGSALPTRMYNFYGTVGYRGFDLAINFNGVAGNKVYDNTANANFYKLRLQKGLNTTAEAVANSEESPNNAAPVSTRYLKDGAFLRLNNLTVGYNFNTGSLGIARWVKTLRVSVTGQNLWLFTKYDGYDPEVNTDRTVNGVSSYGIDYQSYPKAKTLLFGLNLSF